MAAAKSNGAATSGGSDPKDETLTSCLLFEPSVEKGNISLSGLHFIATHQYRAGSYTHLDNLLNPTWNYLTELLPMWLAPNMVTTLGGLHCGLGYGLLWWYAPDFDKSPPDWVIAVCAYCTIAYYTLDCMDGKQARRTGTSSPLGQLFDHGFDCICTLFHLATVSAYLCCGGTYWFISIQTSLQLAFFMAQWEEYHTHILPHCAGKWCGTTEVNYALGLMAFLNSLIDREAFFTRSMKEILKPMGYSFLEYIPDVLEEMELRHVGMCGWNIMSVILMIMSVRRVLIHPRIAPPSASYAEVFQSRVNAMSKLLTPFALCLAAFLVPPKAVRTRYLSVTLGLCFSILTKKIIVFSMAKMPFAAVQWDAFPLLLTAMWIRFDDNLTKMGADFVLGILCFYYTWRMLHWVNTAIDQICERLDIYCFTIKRGKRD
ncbi:hypothetical protein ACHAWX_000953 [Stephanocyclus meneghinianus]